MGKTINNLLTYFENFRSTTSTTFIGTAIIHSESLGPRIASRQPGSHRPLAASPRPLPRPLPTPGCRRPRTNCRWSFPWRPPATNHLDSANICNLHILCIYIFYTIIEGIWILETRHMAGYLMIAFVLTGLRLVLKCLVIELLQSRLGQGQAQQLPGNPHGPKADEVV